LHSAIFLCLKSALFSEKTEHYSPFALELNEKLKISTLSRGILIALATQRKKTLSPIVSS